MGPRHYSRGNTNVPTDNILASLESLDELLNNYSNLSNHSDSHLLSHITELKSKAKELLVSKDNLLDEKYIKHYLSTVTANNSNNDERINNFISKFLILDKDNNDIYLYVDDIILVSEDGNPMTRELDLIDVWFDSGAMPYAQLHYPFENKEKFESQYPADFIAE